MKKRIGKIDAKKSLGQHFLKNPRISEAMAEAGEVKRGDVVLEVGPGTGMLTRELLIRGANVVAIEADIRAVEALQKTFEEEITAKKLVIVHDDVRNVDLGALGLRPSAYKLIANIPYYISGFLFRHFLEHDIPPLTLVFLVQKEVAERIARSEKESVLSLSVKVFGEPRYVKTVTKGNFMPPPKIDSAILAVQHISKDRLSPPAFPRGTLGNAGETPSFQEFFFSVLHCGFKSRRKQLIGNLSGMVARDVLTPTFSTLGLREDVRGEDVPLEKWLALAHKLYTHQNQPLSPQS